ncbi:MAG: hypothetical protein WAP35_06155 [Solirubrobacterales bacterium]
MNSNNSGVYGPKDEVVTVSGTVMFFWDSDDEERHVLVTIEPDDIQRPDAYEFVDDLYDDVIGSIHENVRIEIDYLVEHHEIVDPDAATTVDGHRPRILAVRIDASG